MSRSFALFVFVLAVGCAHDTPPAPPEEPKPFELEEESSLQPVEEPDSIEVWPRDEELAIEGVVSHEWMPEQELYHVRTDGVCDKPSVGTELWHRTPRETNPCTEWGCNGEPSEFIVTPEYHDCPNPDGSTMGTRGYVMASPRETYIRFPLVSKVWHKISYTRTRRGMLGFDVGGFYMHIVGLPSSNLSWEVYRYTGSCAVGNTPYERYLDNLDVIEKFARVDIVHRLAEQLHDQKPINPWWFSPVSIELTHTRQYEWSYTSSPTDFFDRTVCYPPQDVDTIHEVVFPAEPSLLETR